MAENAVRAGTVVDVGDGALAVNVLGSAMTAFWPSSYVPVVGDTVQVLVIDGIASVTGLVHTSPRPMVGTVVSASGGIAAVTTDSGDVTARYMGSAPSAETLVRLDWSTSVPWILGAIDDVPEGSPYYKPPPPPPPPTGGGSGVLTVAAGWSGSWRPSPYSVWENGDVKQDAYGSGVAYEGLWGGYSQAALKSLSGKTITKTQLRVGKRLRIGSFNSSLSLRIFRSSTTGKGNPNTADGPYTESIPANASARWLTVSNSLGNALKDGGSVSIQGGSYGGVRGRSSDPSSGTLRIYWKA